ncbi:MAG: DNA-processing protein DprA [Pseudomonadota bacterium]
MANASRDLTRAERLDWLQLIRTQSIGPVTFRRLVAKYGDAGAALEALPSLAASAGRKKPFVIASRDSVEAELAAADAIGAQAIALIEPHYPAILATIADPPPILYALGHVSLFEKPAVALVGARNASAVGRKLAADFARGLGEGGYAVVSGLARGIDGAAHQAALETGTIAVVAGGVDVIYPPEHADLTHEIARAGLVISERPPGTQPTSRDFPRRNRLISGLSRGVVVVEAAARSGTLITARMAAEQGREVFAAPGSPLDPRCKGSNNLIRDGATLAETAEDIIMALAAQIRGADERERDGFRLGEFDFEGGGAARDGSRAEEDGEDFDAQDSERVRNAVLDLLSPTPIHRDDIIRAFDDDARVGPGRIADALLDLVLSGDAIEEFGGLFSLNPEADA